MACSSSAVLVSRGKAPKASHFFSSFLPTADFEDGKKNVLLHFDALTRQGWITRAIPPTVQLVH